ncbi:type II toxin-antitoxin system VapC family toxin [Cyclobacterium xiamenense]|uniref:type II toxin-antitoxin system VapC family toxin n=1 Tax=Cyclobacterium xiamenense TaxID=1297121 RepID=UPI0012BA018E|nr:type II toxin-antitoxin system VapC family toxin [Cyclobacterium xiamenense]
MNYLLDTNICMHFFRGKFGVTNRLEAVKAENCAISEITLAELVFGAENSKNPEKNHRLIEQFIELVAVLPIYDSIMTYGKEKARLRKTGIMISDLDLFIGCTAIENDLIMVTENQSEFDRIFGIKLENWVDRTK